MKLWRVFPPLCPRCGLTTEQAPNRDAFMCPSPVCDGGVTRLRYVMWPKWRRWLGI